MIAACVFPTPFALHLTPFWRKNGSVFVNALPFFRFFTYAWVCIGFFLEGVIMSEQQAPEVARKKARAERRKRRYDRIMRDIFSSSEDIVDIMLDDGIIDKFRELSYDVIETARSMSYGGSDSAKHDRGGFGFNLSTNDVTIFVTEGHPMTIENVNNHAKKLEKYRRFRDAQPWKDTYHYIGAVVGAMIEPDVIKFAQEQGMYVIVQSGEAVEIIKPPNGFVPKLW
jgi:hypothetical protein